MAAPDVVEENFFLALFNEVLLRINDGRANDEEINTSIERFVDFFRVHGRAGGLCAADNFTTLQDSLGYFYWSSPLTAGITRNKILATLQGCAAFKSCFDQESLRIVSVGGGTGSDLVGLYSAVYGNSNFKEMEVLVFESRPDWLPFFENINELLRDRDFGNASQLMSYKSIATSFVQATMPLNETDDMPENCKEALRYADLVWMKGFLSVLRDDDERDIVTEKIIAEMPRGSLLVLMDSPAYDQFGHFVEEENLRRIHFTGPCRYNLQADAQPMHRISTSSNQEIFVYQKI